MDNAIPPKSNRGRKTKKVRLEPGPITPEQVRAAFVEAECTPPSNEEVKRLSGIFSRWKIFYRGHQVLNNEYKSAVKDTEDANRAVETLERVLPGLIAWHEADQGPFASGQAEPLKKLRDALCKCEDITTRAAPFPDDWRMAFDRAFVEKEIMPHFPAAKGLSKGGPIARFLAVIVPLVAGEAITAVAGPQQLGKAGYK
jgi:hypothetical protein